jgi:UDP-3-O-[3-hydroxymyristoyl] glucosamine N-acyltransferase
MKLKPAIALQEVVDFLGARIIGNSEIAVSGINEIHMVEEGDITFVDHPKYYNKALNSRASIILINKELSPPDGKALIISEDPFRDYVRLAKKFRPFTPSNKTISETASIGEGSIIQPGAFIGNNVLIGENCLIHANVSIYNNTIIGNNVIIHSNTVIGADAYYFQRKPKGYRKLESCGRVIINDDVEIGALCSIDAGVSGDTFIGQGTKFDNHVQVGHDTYIGKHCLIGSHAAIAGVTRIEDDVILWGRVAINKDLVIGKGAVILATSAVDKSLDGEKVYFGIPAIEARKKWKELAMIRKLPKTIEKLENTRK